MRLGALQTTVVWHDPRANFEQVDQLLDEAQRKGVGFAVLPEMFATGFSMDASVVAAFGDDVVAFMARQAASRGMWVAGSAAVPAAVGLPHNQFIAVSPGGETHRCAKRHPFSLAGEHERYQPGRSPLTFAADGVRVSPCVCYDLRFGPDLWDLAPATDLYLVVANWPTARIAHWRALLQARAIENQAYVAGVNRTGEGGGVDYPGASAIFGPDGALIAEALAAPCVLVADIEPLEVAECRRRHPFVADRGTVGAEEAG